MTVLSCDNLNSNGKVTRQVILELANLQDSSLATWISANVTFPCTMVDRIVPATTDEDRAEVAQALGARDEWPVICEPFRQWVIEDNFAAGRPLFEDAGVLMAADVEPYEKMKLRLLNGSHSALAYLGLLKGHVHVRDLADDGELERFLLAMMNDEVILGLDTPEGIDLPHYARTVLERFKNPALLYQLRQIASDGSQKLPQRLLEPLADNLAAGRPIDHLLKAVAAWLLCYTKFAEGKQVFGITDPLTESFLELAKKHGSDIAGLVDAVLADSRIFDPQVWQHDGLKERLTHTCQELMEQHVRI